MASVKGFSQYFLNSKVGALRHARAHVVLLYRMQESGRTGLWLCRSENARKCRSMSYVAGDKRVAEICAASSATGDDFRCRATTNEARNRPMLGHCIGPQWDAGQVPTRTGDVNLRNSAITLCAVIRPVLGFSDGMFSMVMLKLAESDSTSMR